MDTDYKRISQDVKLGKDVVVHAFVNLYGCEVGDGSRIGTFVEIQKNSLIGKRCKIQSHTFICEGVTIEDEVMVAHGVMFINDIEPNAVNQSGGLQTEDDWNCAPTLVKKGASIGSNATILGGITIGEGALVGAGAVVTKDVPDRSVVVGNPATILRMR